MQDFYRCQPGFEQRVDVMMTTICKKKVSDLLYETRVQAVITYYGTILGQRLIKRDARTTMLTRQQYMEVNTSLDNIHYKTAHYVFLMCLMSFQMIPYWCASHPDCWEMLVDKWCSEGWEETHNIHRERRLLASGPSHHQGNRNLPDYRTAWVNESAY
jgi:hypothetical protein